MIKFHIYLFAIATLACGVVTYILLAVGARFDREDELTSYGEPEGSVSKDVEGQRSNHHGEAL